MIPDNEPYVLPNGCLLRVGGRVRVLREHIWLIPEADREFIDLEPGSWSSDSEVLTRRPVTGGGS